MQLLFTYPTIDIAKLLCKHEANNSGPLSIYQVNEAVYSIKSAYCIVKINRSLQI